MEGVLGTRLLHGGSEVPTASLNGSVVGLYFSAHWCPPCREFTPLLKKVHDRCKAQGKSFDVVFCSGDRDEASFKDYFATMPWYALPFSDRNRKEVLSNAYGVRGIPSFVLLNGAGGLIDANARSKVMHPSFPSTLPRSVDVKDWGPPPEGPVKLNVRSAGVIHEIECEANEGWDVLRLQIFSLTNIAPEQQRLFGLGLETGPLAENLPLANALARGISAKRGKDRRPADVPDDRRAGSSVHDGKPPGQGHNQGRLDSTMAWCAKVPEDKEPWYRMDLGEARAVSGIVVSRRANGTQYVTKLKVSSADAEDGPWSPIDGGREFVCAEFDEWLSFSAPVTARYVRIEVLAHVGHPSLRADVLVPCEVVDEPPELVVLGNFSAGDPFEVVSSQPAQGQDAKMMHEQHLAMLQAKMSSWPPKLQNFANNLKGAQKYENRALQRQALDQIPVCRIDKEAVQPKNISKTTYELSFMKQLLGWYKRDFFTWTNAPKCEHCGSANTKTVGSTQANKFEQEFGANNVEVAKCGDCGGQTRFPRYNDPAKLLETRTGRCGEWANCFTLICRALGYEARHVHDWTDHVWTEIWSDSLQRWLHADSCEAALDTPLVYEQGWGKKLNYCVAFGRDDVRDVTRRYTRKFDEVLTRRTMFSEQQLKFAVNSVCEFALELSMLELPAEVQDPRRRAMQARAEREAAELAGEKSAEMKAMEQVGRTSGDQNWRDQRGELGSGSAREQAVALSEQGLACAVPDAGPAQAAPPPADLPPVKEVRVRAGALVDEIEFVHADGAMQSFGRTGGDAREPFTLAEGERLVGFTTRCGDSQDGCSFTTSTGRTSEWYGGQGGQLVAYKAAEGRHITGLQMVDGSCTMKAVGIVESKLPIPEAAPKRPSVDDAKARFAAKFKELLDSGLSKTDAAAQAIEHMKKLV